MAILPGSEEFEDKLLQKKEVAKEVNIDGKERPEDLCSNENTSDTTNQNS